MFTSALITLREGLEAALIIGILLGILTRLGQDHYKRQVWLGVAAAGLVSLITGTLLTVFGMSLSGRGEEIFEGIAMLTAAGVLTWMIFWMQQQGHQIKGELEQGVKEALAGSKQYALFGLAFIAVVREGIETALFMTATIFSTTPVMALLGGLLGLAAAVLLGWLLFSLGKQLNIRAFFRVTGFLLLIFAAGLLAHGIHELQSAALLPVIVEQVWDTNFILDEKQAVGSMAKALFGYNGNPSLLEVIAYFTYFTAILIATRQQERRAQTMQSTGQEA